MVCGQLYKITLWMFYNKFTKTHRYLDKLAQQIFKNVAACTLKRQIYQNKNYQLEEWAALMVWRAAVPALLALITEGQPVLVGKGDS